MGETPYRLPASRRAALLALLHDELENAYAAAREDGVPAEVLADSIAERAAALTADPADLAVGDPDSAGGGDRPDRLRRSR